MRVCAWHSDKPREKMLAEAIVEGVRKSGDEAFMQPLGSRDVADAEVACMVGVKSLSLWKRHQRAGIHTIMLDKGYQRSRGPARVWKYWRVAVDAHNATKFIAESKHRADRWDELGLELRPWQQHGDHIIIAGSSAKYHQFHGLPHPTEYAQRVFRKIRKYTRRPVIYRPKPSWRQATPLHGTRFSAHTESFGDILRGAHCLVTHGSNACFDAMLAGVPQIILGDGITKHLSSTHPKDIENPHRAKEKQRGRWAANVAYAQWTMGEFASGEAWKHIRPQIFG